MNGPNPRSDRTLPNHSDMLERPATRRAILLTLFAWTLRLLFALRRPDLARGGSDTWLALLSGGAFDLSVALLVAWLSGLVESLGAWKLGLGIVSLAVTAQAAAGAIETEYFAFTRNRFDLTFLVYAREVRALGGSVSGEASWPYLALHALLLATVLVLVWRGSSTPAPRPRAPVVMLLAAGVGLFIGVFRPRTATTWYGDLVARTSYVELVRAVAKERVSPLPSGGSAADFAAVRRFTDPFGVKRFVDDASPLVHRGGRAPGNAYGPHDKRLNFIFVMLEGMEASSLALSGGTKGLTPSLDRLASDNFYVRNFFANGAHTPRALDASLCGLAPRLTGAPLSRAQPTMPVRCLPGVLRGEGYATGFIHGGHEQFENRYEFLGRIGFRDTLFFEQFGRNLPTANGGWGATDAQTYEQALAWIDRKPREEPFFLTVLSISNHHPFHVPDPALELEHDPDRLSDNTIRYADREAGRFVEALRSRGLLDSTVVFLFGDHGLTRSNVNADPGAAAVERLLIRANVPLVVVGPAGLFPHAVVDHLASQNDLLPTVLELAGLEAPAHAMGHSLGWTWHDGGRDLPVFVHDLYSQLVADVRADSLEIAGLDDAPSTEAAGSWRWSRGEGGRPAAARIEASAERHASLEAVSRAVGALYASERWWRPALAASAKE